MSWPPNVLQRMHNSFVTLNMLLQMPQQINWQPGHKSDRDVMMMQLSRSQQTKHMMPCKWYWNNVSTFSAMPVHEGMLHMQRFHAFMQHAYILLIYIYAYIYVCSQGMHLARYTGPVLPAATRPHTSSTSNFAAAVNSLSTMPGVQPIVDMALARGANVATSF